MGGRNDDAGSCFSRKSALAGIYFRTNDRLLVRPARVRPIPTQRDSRIAPTATTVVDRTSVSATMPAGLPMVRHKPHRYIFSSGWGELQRYWRLVEPAISHQRTSITADNSITRSVFLLPPGYLGLAFP